MELSQLEERIMPVSDIIYVSDTTNGNVQLINFDPTSNVVGGIEITLQLTITLSDGTTWTKTYSITGGLTSGQIRDLVEVSLTQAGFTVKDSGGNSLIIAGKGMLGINSAVWTVVNDGGLKNPNQYLPSVSGTK